ncbi:hypothetical protein ES288_D08G316400v1 [Gossypium darwinii]|uniref:RING-type domain-containing protein n=1 Tax=Gossypium darwinii TaxID=34276 RepID=A0A5D2BU19_GOSDA|nr:unnamed protein product [Gossypium raimondii]XP_012466455.1 unnamed protein product [Gossypium raimondii]XP_012466456.1 unnamed protein product [Gossypium raimondii]XP_012466457.1 unnamed protein product [Gossypium raimondii]XP_012466458.1 unnamed protein product [Gossypium raimondii]XP_012466459.1 unnamed protein product [Gossypium raimondii]TYG59603.1 hypothetical protein ES288_D08G316400v1 [Gossypium darwinii]
METEVMVACSIDGSFRCYICLLEYEEGDSMRIFACNHEFHRTCIDKWLKEVHREDFERTGISTLVTVGVRDIQGEGFLDQFSGLADSVFLDLPQPWLAIPSA